LIALDYLKSLPRSWLPLNDERGIHPPSNGDLKRWLNNKAITINGYTPDVDDHISYPVKELIFFPKSKKRRTTIWKA